MKKIILIIGFCFAGLFFIWVTVLWKKFKLNGEASYPAAESWSFPVKVNQMIVILNEIKNEHPELVPPNEKTPLMEKDDFGYHFSFHYPNTQEDVHVILRPNSDSSNTTLLFVAVYSHIDPLTDVTKMKMYNKEINRDFNYFENLFQINKFKNAIIKPINAKFKTVDKNG